jgi:hypothetical protein
MPKEMAEKLLKGEEIGTTKKDGYGIDATDNGNDKSNEKQARDRFKRRRMDSIYSYISKKREANTRWFVDKI